MLNYGETMTDWFNKFGALRIMLLLLAIVCIIFYPRPDAEIIYDSLSVMSTLVVPVMSPMIFMVVMLDVMMTRIFMADSTDENKARLRDIMRVELIVAAILILSWLPFFITITYRGLE
ncbi:MAG: hypothetical protein AAF512_17510 [Pseudomonadota bacterium]